VDEALIRFSGSGSAAVAALVATGLVNGWFLVGSPSALFGSTYGGILSAKIALFAVMLAIAAANRLWLVPALAARDACPARIDALRNRLRAHVVAEQVLGLLILASISILGTIRPAVGH
jgi:putative copper resistance protein D